MFLRTFLRTTVLLFVAGFILTVAGASQTRSVVFYGAGNYDDEKGAPALAIYEAGNPNFSLPAPGAAPNKRDILKWTLRDLTDQWGPQTRIKIYINDISEGAAKKAAEVLKKEIVLNRWNAEVSILVGDFTTIPLPCTDKALLQNPDEIWFYEQKTAKPFSDPHEANRNLAILQRLADHSKTGLEITTYYHDAMAGYENVLGMKFINSGNGYPYVWPDGHIDQRTTTRYILTPRSHIEQMVSCERELLSSDVISHPGLNKP